MKFVQAYLRRPNATFAYRSAYSGSSPASDRLRALKLDAKLAGDIDTSLISPQEEATGGALQTIGGITHAEEEDLEAAEILASACVRAGSLHSLPQAWWNACITQTSSIPSSPSRPDSAEHGR